MKPFLTRLLVILSLGLLLGGCASYDVSVDKGHSLKTVKRFFVVGNSNDNRALGQQIAMALKANDRTADVGPLTMMPDDTQAVIAFSDHWTWDFGEHLVYLKITVRDPLSNQPYASITFDARVPLREKPVVTVNRLVEALLAK